MTKPQILTEAMTLDPQEREELADELWVSLTSVERAEIDAAWLAESHRQDEVYKRGEIGASSVDVVIDRVVTRLEQ